MALELRFLGPWQVLADGEPVRLAGQRRIGVLARLALDAGQAVHAERLLTDIWADSSAATAAKQLHIVVSKLRETLAPHTTEEIIQTVPGSYRLALDPDHIDAHRFTRLAKRARTAQAQGATDAADTLYRRALHLWRGDPLAELAAPWARIEATRLDEEHLTVLEEHASLPRRKAGALNNLSVIHTLVGRLDDALAYLESAFALIDDAEHPVGSVVLRNNRVHVHYRQGRFDEAIAEARQLVELWPKVGTAAEAGIAHGSLGDAYRHAGRLTEAADSYATSGRLLRESGYRLREAVSRWWFGITLPALGRHGEAREQWEDSVGLLCDARLLTPREATELLAQPVPETPQLIKNML